MAVEASLPTIGVVLVTAVIDSINPCAIGVLILLVSTLLATRKKNQLLSKGLLYIGVVYVIYFLAGLGLIAFLANIPQVIAEYISIVVGAVVVFAGLVEIKDYFWYGQGFSLMIPQDKAKKIHDLMQNLSVWTVIFLGAFVAAVELPCTGGPYLAITLLLSQNFNFTAFILLVIYNIIFVMPLAVILFMVYFGTKIQTIKRWKMENRAVMRLATGLVLIALGWLLILIANGTINLG
ncbi:GAP family protein [Candidatus Woesearchaeota archaeon]|nr:GAP family protein [Candidatus Woesearchaeota archaeon]